VSPLTVQLVADSELVVQVGPPEEVTVYFVIVAPPLPEGAVQVTNASPPGIDPPVAVTPVGAPGTLTGVTLFDAEEAVPVPLAFVAVTVKV
jgi:hypothetical protein